MRGADEVIAVLDGLVLSGGGDVDPRAYSQEPDAEVGGVDTNRDASERALLAAALRADLPVLAICRGCQVLNVELGGTLHQHLPDVIGNLAHRSAPFVFGDVEVQTVPGTRAAAVFGPSPTVLCSHHQSIAALGRGLVTTASAADGVIEAVELPTARFVLGVQWHPEEGMDQRPFDALVAAAITYAAGAVGAPQRVIAQASGRVAVVTGASRGLGAGLAVHFAAAGMHLALCARHKPALAVRTRPTAHDGHVVRAETPVLAALDVTDRAALERFADEVVARFGRIDLWVNNAGLLGDIRPLAEADPLASSRTVEVNVNGTLHGSAVFAAHVRRRAGPGVLVNISSGAATTPYEGWAAYCASKAAVDQLTRVVAVGGGAPRPAGLRPVTRAWSTPTCRRPSGPRTSVTSRRSSASAASPPRTGSTPRPGWPITSWPSPSAARIRAGSRCGCRSNRSPAAPGKVSGHAQERCPQGGQAGGGDRRDAGNDRQHLVVRPQAAPQREEAGRQTSEQ